MMFHHPIYTSDNGTEVALICYGLINTLKVAKNLKGTCIKINGRKL